MNNTISSNALQTTTSYATTGLDGTETYVWTLETATGGYYLKNVNLTSNQYLNNSSSTNVSLGNKSSIWTFAFTDGVALISNKSNSNRFLGYTNSTSYAYKAYASGNLESYDHAITVYQLEEEGSGVPADPEDASWSVSPSSVTVKAGKITTADITTNYNGVLTLTSSNSSIATATYADGVLTVTGVAEGDAYITIEGNATAKYNAISKTVDVHVVPNVVTSGTYSITPNNTFYGETKTYSGNDASNPSSLTGESEGVTITYSKGSQSYFYVSTSQTRTYDGSTMAFSVPTGFVITAINFTADGNNWNGNHTASVGGFTDNKYKSWSGAAKDVTITFKGTCRITNISVTIVNSFDKDILASKWATWVAPYNVEVPSGVSAYIVTSATTTAALEEVLGIPAGTPVLLNGDAGTKTFTICDAGDCDDVSSNLLEVSDAETTSGVYVLAERNSKVGFYLWDGGLIGAGRVILPASAVSSVREFIGFDFAGETSIKSVDNSQAIDNAVFDLSGRRVSKATKGIYIVNGKKVVK